MPTPLSSDATPVPPPACCPRCGQGFVCQPHNIAQCACVRVGLTSDERAFIAAAFPTNECLCPICLHRLQVECQAQNATALSPA